MLKPLSGSQQTEKYLKTWEYQTTWPVSWEICMQVKKQQLKPDMKQWTDSKLEKEYVKAVYCHPAYLTSMQSSTRKMLAEWSPAGIKIARRDINNLRYADDTTLMAESEEELRTCWWKWKRRMKKLA